jgi:hypothetical protein
LAVRSPKAHIRAWLLDLGNLRGKESFSALFSINARAADLSAPVIHGAASLPARNIP